MQLWGSSLRWSWSRTKLERTQERFGARHCSQSPNRPLSFRSSGWENPELRAALSKTFDGDLSDLTQSESSVLAWYYSGVMRVTENRFRQYRLGILDEESLAQFGGHARVFRTPYFKEWWPGSRYQFPPDFVEYVEDNLLPLEVPGR